MNKRFDPVTTGSQLALSRWNRSMGPNGTTDPMPITPSDALPSDMASRESGDRIHYISGSPWKLKRYLELVEQGMDSHLALLEVKDW